MADNYLEKRMEELRSGRLSHSASSRSAAQGPRAGYLNVKYPPRRVLVTGGASGIGLATVRSFLRAGCKVAVIDSDEEQGRRLAREEGVRFYHLDLADSEALSRAMQNIFAAWHDLDIIVSNAGVFSSVVLEDADPADFDRTLDVNLRPAYLMAREWALWRRALPYPNSYGGRMLLISSTRHLQSESGTEPYSASKGALASLTHALMMSLADYRITVNSISPGWIHTGSPDELTDSDHRQHPSRRVGRPEDVARLILFLTWPDNDFINGTDIPVDGGMTHRMIYD